MKLGVYTPIGENNCTVRNEQGDIETLYNDEETVFHVSDSNETTSKGIELAIVGVLLGPFRSHEAFLCFPSSNIPWEGFLIFRRLALIIVLTFVYDIQFRLFLALTVCVAILIIDMFVNPFRRKSLNVLESLFLGAHVVLCGSSLTKALYCEAVDLFVFNVIENILTVAPLSLVAIAVIFCIVAKLIFGVKQCVSFITRNLSKLCWSI